MADIFNQLLQQKEASEKAVLQSSDGRNGDALIDFNLTASFLEIYGENIHDLLNEEMRSLPIREDSNGAVIVKGLINTPINSDVEAMNVLNTGSLNRSTASTLMNLTSSRSHAVFTVNLQKTTRSPEGMDITTTSRFTFVDLAGSERMKKTGAEGERAKEGIKINEGLLALGNVINALGDEERLAKGEKIHVPYRQSKLTRLLSDSLGGNSQTLFLACVSPSDTNASETLSTLQYANRARNIKNAVTRNVDAAAVELKRLHTLTNILKCELIRQRFMEGVNESSVTSQEDIGEVNEELFQREDVIAYMNQIDEKTTQLSGGSTSSSLVSFPTHSVASTSDDRQFIQVPSISNARASIAAPLQLDGDEDDMIEEDIQIINELLELQQKEKAYEKGQKDDQERLDSMSSEIETQESKLVQLREHLEVYHSMKSKYETIIIEVQTLETEKKSLADQLDKAQVDPTKGCSRAIKAKLQKIEQTLARARSDTRKHQQMYRKAEQEAKKCKVLERKIADLKHAKVNMIKKQREDSARHKEFTNQKTREIHALKRKERTADRKLSKMENECNKFKINLERSRSHCDKLSDKLKQTETHLLRLLSKRRNDLKSTRQSKACDGIDGFSAVNEEVKSIKYLLEKTIKDKVAFHQNKEAYESMVVEYGQLLQELAKESQLIRELKQEYKAAYSNDAEIAEEMREHEESIQELQLQIELVENDIDQLQVKCPRIFEEEDDDEDESDVPTQKMISKLDGSVLRTLLWTLLESYVSTELNRRVIKDMLIKKDSVLESLENEHSMLNERIHALTNSLDKRRKLASPDGQEEDAVDIIENLEKKIQVVETKLETCLADKNDFSTELKELQTSLSEAQVLHAESEERVALLLSQQKLTESTKGTDQMLIKLQDVFKVTGTSSQERESIRQKLENCVEDACSNMLNEATSLRDEKIQEVNVQRKTLTAMYAALGLMDTTTKSTDTDLSLNDQLQFLKRQTSEIQSQYQVAIERRNQLESEAIKLTSAIGGDTSESLQKLMSTNRRASKLPAKYRASMSRAEMFKDVKNMMKDLQVIDEASEEVYPAQRKDEPKTNSAEPASLSTTFLDSCEQDIKKLRLLKSERQLSNTATCNKIRIITKQMHVSGNELSEIVQTQGNAKELDGHVLRSVYDAIFKRGSVLITISFTNHLNIVLEIIQDISLGRKLLSDTLAKEIKECHTALITTAKDCGMDVTDMASSLHDALFHLPPLSKEYIEACIDNVQMLVTAVETITVSEVETLTVLFEGLGLSSRMRGRFWNKIDEQTSEIEMTSTSPFDNLQQGCSAGVEQWVIKSSSDAARIQKVLCVRVFKLSQIHKEVESLKIKQQSKNGILSLNSELQILSIKLAAFEDKAGDKQRLLNKKANSSSLLEEERFRKQMQSSFKSKLDSLCMMLNDWESKYGGIEESDPLHEIVNSMLEMSEKTGLMHLRTANTKSSFTNKQGRPSSVGRANIRPTSGGGRSRDASSTQSSTSTITRHKPTTQTSSRYCSVPPVNRRPTRQNSNRPSISTKQYSRQSNISQPQRPKNLQQQRKALSASTHNANRSERETTRPLALKVESVLDPFANIAETPTPKGENQHYF